MTQTASPAALQHLRVVDLTRVRAGPTCCRVLADFGADVIKIDAPPGVDPNEGMSGERHGYDMLNLHRNKRSLAVNLKTPDGIAIVHRMVETADIVVENFRPDVKDRLKLDYATLSAINPAVILASISGFGQTGPYSQRAGFDQIAQGMGGLMAVTGQPGQGPMRAGTAVADSSAGLYAATGILIALAEREISGRGQWLHTSLLQAQIALMDFQAARYLIDNQVPGQAGNDHPYSTPMGVVQCSDGYLNLGVGGDKQWRDLCVALEHPQWQSIDAYASADSRAAHRDEIWALLRPVFILHSCAHWLEALEKHGVPAGPIYTMDQVFADPQVQQSGMAPPLHHAARGEIRVVGQPLTLERTPASYRRAAPDAGQHSEEILQQYGYAADAIADLKERRVIA